MNEYAVKLAEAGLKIRAMKLNTEKTFSVGIRILYAYIQ